MESNDSPEIPDRGETSDIPGLPSWGLQKKVDSLKDIVDSLKLKTTFSGVPLRLMKRIMSKKGMATRSYHPALKAFARTLQFYSTKAYNYVRETFGLGLPHVVAIRKWYSAINGSAWF